MVKFSIITVCFNAVDNIENTIKSVVNQKYSDYEYIIVDGGSTDETVNIISSYAQIHPCVKYISQKDEGLYHAMNKGVKMASGEYVEFLNAGDLLADEKTLSKVSDYIDKNISDDAGIFYGNIIYLNQDGSENTRIYGDSCGKAIYFATGDCVNHQACFASRKCFEKYDFDYKTYRICADRDWMMKQTKSGVKWKAIGEIVVKYELSDESISARDKKLLKEEERKCLAANYPWMLPIYAMFEFLRNNKILAAILHKIYKVLYIRK